MLRKNGGGRQPCYTRDGSGRTGWTRSTEARLKPDATYVRTTRRIPRRPREVGAKPTRSRHCKRGAARHHVTGDDGLPAVASWEDDGLRRSASQETWYRGRPFSARETPGGT